MKDVLMITHFTQTPGENGNGRFDYLARMLSDSCHVEMVTTTFSHRNKAPRKVTREQLEALPYTLTMLRESGYQKNVSLKRFFSHYQFSRSLHRYLQTRKKPDVIYCTVPSLDGAAVAARYAKQHQIPFIIDVQDLWPEAFKMMFHVPVISDLMFAPMKKKANYIYSCADTILGVSETYCNRAKVANKKNAVCLPIFLGTNLETFDRNVQENAVLCDKNTFTLAYCGTLGHSYDILCVLDAMIHLRDDHHISVSLRVMGDGPLKGNFEQYAQEHDLDVEFYGRIPYEKMCGLLAPCDVCVNPISKGAAQSIINKHGDYAAAGIPVINTQESPEYRLLVEQYHMGINVENGNSVALAAAIATLQEDEALRQSMGQGARRCAEECFDRRVTYERLANAVRERL